MKGSGLTKGLQTRTSKTQASACTSRGPAKDMPGGCGRMCHNIPYTLNPEPYTPMSVCSFGTFFTIPKVEKPRKEALNPQPKSLNPMRTFKLLRSFSTIQNMSFSF